MGGGKEKPLKLHPHQNKEISVSCYKVRLSSEGHRRIKVWRKVSCEAATSSATHTHSGNVWQMEPSSHVHGNLITTGTKKSLASLNKYDRNVAPLLWYPAQNTGPGPDHEEALNPNLAASSKMAAHMGITES